MLLSVADFREFVDNDLDRLVACLQDHTGRYTKLEDQAWRASLPKVVSLFDDPTITEIGTYFREIGNLVLEYRMPGAASWADLLLIGKHKGKPSIVVVELKDWVTHGDQPGPIEGLMFRHGHNDEHPSDQVRGYVEYCRRFHSTVLERDASVHGCVFFTKDPYYHSYELSPNKGLTDHYPCFSALSNSPEERARLKGFLETRLTEPDPEFAREFIQGVYKQTRGFVQQIGEQIQNPKRTAFVLLDHQRLAFHEIQSVLERIITAKKKPCKSLVIVQGPPGSGKSVVAAQVWASMVTNPKLPQGNVVITTTSASQSSNWKHLFSKATKTAGGQGAIIKATAYTPATTGEFGKLRKNYPDAFRGEANWRENLAMMRSLAPDFRSGSRDDEFLVSIVDEAHALINPEHTNGRGQFGFATAFGPQAYHIMRCSTVSVLFMDSEQGFRDRENTTIADLKYWAKELGIDDVKEISLAGNQFRCAGSIEYLNAIDKLLNFNKHTVSVPSGTGENRSKESDSSPNKRFQPYEVDIVNGVTELEEKLRDKIRTKHTVRLLSSFSREWKTKSVARPHCLPGTMMDFHISYDLHGKTHYWSKVWNYVPKGDDYTHYIQAPVGSEMHKDPLTEIGCPYVVRGFDFDYVGLLWMSDLKRRKDRWIVTI